MNDNRKPVPPSPNGHQSDDAAVHARAREIVASWQAKQDRDMFARAYTLAKREAQGRERAARDADPSTWPERHHRAGTIGLTQVWPGCPVDHAKCIRQGDGWDVDPASILFVDSDTGKVSHVASPIVALSVDRFALLLPGGDWRTIIVPPPPRGADSGGAHHRAVLTSLARAGATFGDLVDRTQDRDHPELEPAADYAILWLFGTLRGTIVGSPVRTLAEFSEERAIAVDVVAGIDGKSTPSEATAAKAALGEVMARHPGGGR